MDDLVGAVNTLYTTAKTLREALEVVKPNHQEVKDLYSQLKESFCPAVRATLHCSAGDEGKTAAAVQGIIQQLNQALLDCRGVVWPWVRMPKSSQVFNKLDLPSLLTKVASTLQSCIQLMVCSLLHHRSSQVFNKLDFPSLLTKVASALQSSVEALNHLVKDLGAVVATDSEPSSATVEQLHQAVGVVLERLEGLTHCGRVDKKAVCAYSELYEAVRELKTGSVDDPRWRKALRVATTKVIWKLPEKGPNFVLDLNVIPAIMAHINTNNKDVKGDILTELPQLGGCDSLLDALLGAGFVQALVDTLISDNETPSTKLGAAHALQHLAEKPRARQALRTARVVDALGRMCTTGRDDVSRTRPNSTTVINNNSYSGNNPVISTTTATANNTTTAHTTTTTAKTTTTTADTTTTTTTTAETTTTTANTITTSAHPTNINTDISITNTTGSGTRLITNSNDDCTRAQLAGVLFAVCGTMDLQDDESAALLYHALLQLLDMLRSSDAEAQQTSLDTIYAISNLDQVMVRPLREAHAISALLTFLKYNSCSTEENKNGNEHRNTTRREDDSAGRQREYRMLCAIDSLYNLTAADPEFMQGFKQQGGLDVLLDILKRHRQASQEFDELERVPDSAVHFLREGFCNTADHRQMLLKAGAVPALLGFMGESIGSRKIEDLVQVLLSLVAEDASCQEVITEAGLLHPVVAHLNEDGLFQDDADVNQEGGEDHVTGNAAESAAGATVESHKECCDDMQADCVEENVGFDVGEAAGFEDVQGEAGDGGVDGEEAVEVGVEEDLSDQDTKQAGVVDGGEKEEEEEDVDVDGGEEEDAGIGDGEEEDADIGDGAAEDAEFGDGAAEDDVEDGASEDADDDTEDAIHEQAKKAAAHRMLAACVQDVPALVDLIRSRTAYILDHQGNPKNALGAEGENCSKDVPGDHDSKGSKENADDEGKGSKLDDVDDDADHFEGRKNDLRILIKFLSKLLEKHPACRPAAIQAGAIPALIKAFTACQEDAAVAALAQLSIDQPQDAVSQAITDASILPEVAATMYTVVQLNNALSEPVKTAAGLIVDMFTQDVSGVVKYVDKARSSIVGDWCRGSELVHRTVTLLLHKLMKVDDVGSFKQAAADAGLIPTLLAFFKPDCNDVNVKVVVSSALALICQDDGAAGQALGQSGVLHDVVEYCPNGAHFGGEPHEGRMVAAACEALVQTCARSGCKKCLKRKRDADQ